MEKAARAYERSFKADTTLWAASTMYEYLVEEYGTSGMLEVDSAIIKAHWRHIEDTPSPFREFAEARDWQNLTLVENLQLYEEVLAEHPTFWPVVMDYADNLLFGGYLYGYSADDAIRAQADCVAVVPDNMGCWVKLYFVSAGKDAAAFQRGY